eukprot:TRINITY_DN73650_c0_g1_i1.p1 TRINITY_DN73650_c0_g1~~TRINITY_DN73650_c0_g1_i1.p1  ORF type:complete len:446 (+),score=64.00 TRINITY_DN73650_c0_g1_i1:13-1350(+)
MFDLAASQQASLRTALFQTAFQTAMVSVVFVACACLVARISAEHLARTFTLDDEPEDGARCLDGSPARFWILEAPEGTNKTKWSFHLMGGGNCGSLDECAGRGYDLQDGRCYLGSSSVECFNANPDALVPFAAEMRFEDIPSCKGARWCGGLMNSDPLHNPLTYDWNKVFVQYCDGGMWMGSNATASLGQFGGKSRSLFFRGMKNADGVLTRLLRDHGLAGGTDLILSGDSSGGIGTLWQADHFKQRLGPYGIRVVAVPDHGYFFEDHYWIKHDYDWRGILRWSYNQMNGTVNQRCVHDALKSDKDPAEFCTLPETSTPYIQTPLFLVNSRYDPTWEVDKGMSHAETNRLGHKLIRLFNETALNRPGNAAFITSCSEHCGQWSQNQRLPDGNSDFQVYIDGYSAASAVNAWFGGFAPQKLWVQPESYPCDKCCHVKPPGDSLVFI